MIVDASVWIEFFSTSDSAASRWVSDHIADGMLLVVPEVVLMVGDTAAVLRPPVSKPIGACAEDVTRAYFSFLDFARQQK